MAQQTFASGDTAPTVRGKLNSNVADVAAHHADSTDPHGVSLTQTNLTVTGTFVVSDGQIVQSIKAQGQAQLTDDVTIAGGDGIAVTQAGQIITLTEEAQDSGTLTFTGAGDWWVFMETTDAPVMACAVASDGFAPGGTYDADYGLYGGYYGITQPTDHVEVSCMVSNGFWIIAELTQARTVKWRAWFS